MDAMLRFFVCSTVLLKEAIDKGNVDALSSVCNGTLMAPRNVTALWGCRVADRLPYCLYSAPEFNFHA